MEVDHCPGAVGPPRRAFRLAGGGRRFPGSRFPILRKPRSAWRIINRPRVARRVLGAVEKTGNSLDKAR